MNGRVETVRFEWEDPAARVFLREHGYVIVSGVLGEDERDYVQRAWDEVTAVAAARVGMTKAGFVERFPQNRDLWRKHEDFRRLLFDSRQASIARHLLGVSGIRLFHDHAICKPAHASDAIPWHQDSTYWPLDRVGISLWTAVDDVPFEGGCLKVLDGSHLLGAGEPEDFLSGDGRTRDEDPRLVFLPARCGETVVLSGLTWHGSAPNRGEKDRLAYLTLWVPATARFVPEHAGWHPTASHIHVAPGERLEGDWFPLFGEISDVDEGEQVTVPRPVRRGGPSMFTASRDIAEQIGWLLGEPAGSLDMLLAGDGLARVVTAALAAGLIAAECAGELHALLSDLVLQERVRRESVARDVYLRSVTRWWEMIGTRIAEARGAA